MSIVAIQSLAYLSAETYLAEEEISPIKHEYVDGQVYAMTGGTDHHNAIAGNLFAILKNHLRGTGCRTFISDIKARIEPLNIFYYPDVMVTCDERDRETSLFKRYPCLLVEVLSNSTEAFDRGDKFADYQQLESLQEYVLISQKRQRVDCFRRDEAGRWVLYSFNAGEVVHLVSVNLEVGMDALYEDVPLIDSQPIDRQPDPE
jgi:Uma2 family endonuclease